MLRLCVGFGGTRPAEVDHKTGVCLSQVIEKRVEYLVGIFGKINLQLV